MKSSRHPRTNGGLALAQADARASHQGDRQVISEPTQSSVAPAAREASVRLSARPDRVGRGRRSAAAAMPGICNRDEPLGAYPKRLTDRLVERRAKRIPSAGWSRAAATTANGSASAMRRCWSVPARSARRCSIAGCRPSVRSSSCRATISNTCRSRSARCGPAFRTAPISPAYSLVSTDYGKLRHAIELLTPGTRVRNGWRGIRRRDRGRRAGRR